jgi:anti-sigma regulatory factor (Ser/Thr protein kinase)
MLPLPSGIHISRRLRPDATSVAQARGALEPLESAVDPGTFETLRLLVSELITFGVCHGTTRPADMELSVLASRERIRVEVMAPGLESPAAPEAATADPPSLGLDLVEALSDRCGSDSNNGTCVWCELVDSGAFTVSAAR